MIVLRRPDPAEAETLARLHIRCWREAYAGIVPEEVLAAADLSARTVMWRHCLADGQSIVVAGFTGADPVGFVMAGPNREPRLPEADGHVAAIYVLRAWYRQGLGRRLLAEAARQWRGRGGRSLGLGVLSGNARARAFYESLGGRLLRTGNYVWDGHALPDALYIFEDLADLGRIA